MSTPAAPARPVSMAQAPPSAGAHAPAPVRAAPVRASPPAGAPGAIQCAQVVRPPVVAMAASVGSPSAIQEAAGVGSEPSVLMARIAQRDAQIAGLRAEVNMANAEIARLRDAVAAMPPRGPPRTETEAGPAPGVPAPGGGIVARPMPPPVNTLARPYRLVQVNPERFPHQRQVMRDGAVRLIVDKRRLLYLVVQLQDEYGRPADPFDLQPRGLELELTVHLAGAPEEALRAQGDSRINWSSKAMEGGERRLLSLSKRHNQLTMYTPQITAQFKLLLLSQEVDGRLLQLKVAPTTPALRTRVEPMFSQAIICMSRKPDSRRTPGLLMGMPPPPGTSPYEVEVGDPRRVPPAPPNMQSLQHAAHAAHAQGFPLGHVAPGSQPMGNYPGRPVAAPLSPDAVGNYPGRPGHHGQAQAQAAQAAQAQARGCYPNRAAAPGEEPWKPPDHLKPAPAPQQQGEGQGEGGGVVVLDGAPVRARMPPQLATTVAAPVGPNGAMTTAIGEVEYPYQVEYVYYDPNMHGGGSGEYDDRMEDVDDDDRSNTSSPGQGDSDGGEGLADVEDGGLDGVVDDGPNARDGKEGTADVLMAMAGSGGGPGGAAAGGGPGGPPPGPHGGPPGYTAFGYPGYTPHLAPGAGGQMPPNFPYYAPAPPPAGFSPRLLRGGPQHHPTAWYHNHHPPPPPPPAYYSRAMPVPGPGGVIPRPGAPHYAPPTPYGSPQAGMAAQAQAPAYPYRHPNPSPYVPAVPVHAAAAAQHAQAATAAQAADHSHQPGHPHQADAQPVYAAAGHPNLIWGHNLVHPSDRHPLSSSGEPSPRVEEEPPLKRHEAEAPAAAADGAMQEDA